MAKTPFQSPHLNPEMDRQRFYAKTSFRNCSLQVICAQNTTAHTFYTLKPLGIFQAIRFFQSCLSMEKVGAKTGSKILYHPGD